MRPLRVRVGGKDWRVLWSRRMADCGRIEFGRDRESRIIRLRDQQSDDELLDTAIHEALHAQSPEIEEYMIEARSRELSGLILRLFDVARKDRFRH